MMKTHMHVLFIPSWYPTYPTDTLGCFFREQALSLKQHGMQLGVITPALRSLSTGISAWTGPFGIKEELDDGIPTMRFHGIRAFSWHDWLNMKSWELAGLRAFKKYCAKHGTPDVIHVHGMIFGLSWAAAIHCEYGIPFVVTEHSTEFALGNIRRPLLSYLTDAINHAASLFGVSRELCNRLGVQIPAPNGNSWQVMPNLVSSRFDLPTTADKERVNNVDFVFLNVATLSQKKGQHHLLRALAQVRATRPELRLRLRIAGGGPEERALLNLTAELGIGDRVTFLGDCPRERIVQEMKNCNAFVLASSYETFGVVVIEALMCGKPVLSTRCGGPEDIVRPGKDGWLVEKDSPDAIAGGLIEMIENHAQFNSNMISQDCMIRYGEEAFVRRHAAAYVGAIFNHGSPK